MRLIDADKLPLYEVYKDDIDEAPTVDAEVVRHGYWTEENNCHEAMRIGDYEEWFECSLCGGQEGRESEWCPHCGAKMDAKEGESNDGRAD